MNNTGVLLGRRASDFVAGEANALPYEVRNPSGDWTPFAPPGERQWNWKADSMSCVTFSALNSIETQEKFLTGQQPNYSDRWIAKVSETTDRGNYLWKVADAIRDCVPGGFGLVLDSDYPTPQEPWTFTDWMADIPEPLLSDLKRKGKEWLGKWRVNYEWVNADITPEGLLKQLKHAPLQMVIPGHAILGIYCEQDLVKYLDTYEPYLREAKVSAFTDALKIVLTPMIKKYIIEDGGKLGVAIIEGETGVIQFAPDMASFRKLLEVAKLDEATAKRIRL